VHVADDPAALVSVVEQRQLLALPDADLHDEMDILYNGRASW
jgi:hypothetical protein